MKNLFLSLFLVSSLSLNTSARQSMSSVASIITDWCLNRSAYIFEDWGWYEIKEYVECGGTQTKVDVQMIEYEY